MEERTNTLLTKFLVSCKNVTTVTDLVFEQARMDLHERKFDVMSICGILLSFCANSQTHLYFVEENIKKAIAVLGKDYEIQTFPFWSFLFHKSLISPQSTVNADIIHIIYFYSSETIFYSRRLNHQPHHHHQQQRYHHCHRHRHLHLLNLRHRRHCHCRCRCCLLPMVTAIVLGPPERMAQ